MSLWPKSNLEIIIHTYVLLMVLCVKVMIHIAMFIKGLYAVAWSKKVRSLQFFSEKGVHLTNVRNNNNSNGNF